MESYRRSHMIEVVATCRDTSFLFLAEAFLVKQLLSRNEFRKNLEKGAALRTKYSP